MKNITSIVLALVISTTGIPCFLIEDASRDGAVDLQDVILQVQDFTEAAEGIVSFDYRFEKMLSTLSHVADLKTLLNPDKEKKSTKHQLKLVISPDRFINSFSIHVPPQFSGSEEYYEYLTVYESRDLDPSVPPPRIS